MTELLKRLFKLDYDPTMNPIVFKNGEMVKVCQEEKKKEFHQLLEEMRMEKLIPFKLSSNIIARTVLFISIFKCDPYEIKDWNTTAFNHILFV